MHSHDLTYLHKHRRTVIFRYKRGIQNRYRQDKPRRIFGIHQETTKRSVCSSPGLSVTVRPTAPRRLFSVGFIAATSAARPSPPKSRSGKAPSGSDALESVSGKVVDDMRDYHTELRQSGNVDLTVARASVRSADRLADIAQLHLKLKKVHGALVLYGERPHTELMHMSMDNSEGIPRMSLTPIV